MDRQRRLATIVLLVVLATVYAGFIAFTVERDAAEDFTVYYLAARLTREGESPYTVPRNAWDRTAADEGMTDYQWPYRYPPLTAVLVRPLVPLGYTASLIVWEGAAAAALIAGTLLVAAALGGRRRTPRALFLLLLCGPAYVMLYVGQVNALLYLFVALAFWALVRESDLLAAAGLALGTALKVTPAALVAYLFWQRRWRQAALAVAMLAGAAVLCVAVVGTRAVLDYGYKAYSLTAPDEVKNSPGIDTFRAMVGRLTLDWPGGTDPDTVRWVSLVALGLTIALVAVSAALAWPRRGPAGAAHPAQQHEYAMIVAGTLLIGPFTFYHQFVLLLIPLLVVADHLWSAGRRTLLAIVLALYLAVGAQEIAWRAGRGFFLDSGLWRALSFPFALTLALWAACALAVWREKWRPA